MFLILMGLLIGVLVNSPTTSDIEGAIGLIVMGSLLLLLALYCLFQVLACQQPILKIYQEGVKIRTIGSRVAMPFECSPITFFFLNLIHLPVVVLTFVAAWQIITLKAFRIRAEFVDWACIEITQPEKGSLAVVAWLKSENDETIENPCTFSYEASSFGMPLDKVYGALLYYYRFRETLPSWQEEKNMFDCQRYDVRRW